MKEAQIELTHVKKYFEITKGIIKQKKTYVKAVDDVTMTINKGEIVGLVGESGSGKTTLARVILNLTKPTGGTVIFDHVDLSKATKQEKKEFHTKVSDPRSAESRGEGESEGNPGHGQDGSAVSE